ncbi:MAG TPA: hypothetical protein VGM73_12060 [Candidatus Didemnitutus sp.]
MAASAIPALPENSQLAFVGEDAWPPAVITERQAEMFRAAANPTGRANSDVLLGFLRLERGQFATRWQIDFSPHLTEQEASVYQAPFKHLTKKLGADLGKSGLVNPGAKPSLRSGLARLDRFLVARHDEAAPRWIWIDAGWLPDASLVAVARDDDFSHGVLQSRAFLAWWSAVAPEAGAAAAIESFPFPWPVRTAYGALTGIQQDMRFEIARAARNSDRERLDAMVGTAYGFPPQIDDPELLLRLQRLNRRRSGREI